MIDKEQRIEKIAKTLRNRRVEQGFNAFDCKISCEKCPSKQFYCVEREYAETLYNAGYKQENDVAKEVAEKIYSKLSILLNGRAFMVTHTSINEVLKEYGEELGK